MSDKGYRSAEFEEHLNNLGMIHVRPATKNEKPDLDKDFLRHLRQSIEDAFRTLKSQLSLERHHTPHPRRHPRTHPATHPRPPRSHLWHNQNHQPARTTTLPHRLQPLTPLEPHI